VWKRAKLVTLVLITVLLAWTTYPSWRSLVRDDEVLRWDTIDALTAVVPDKDAWTGSIGIGTGVQAGLRYSERPYIHAELVAAFTRRDLTSDAAPVYLHAKGRSKKLVEHCSLGPELSYSDLPVHVSQYLSTVPSYDELVVALPEGVFRCSVPVDQIWSSSDANHTLKFPYLGIFGFSQAQLVLEREELYGTNFAFDVRNDLSGAYCAYSRMTYDAGIAIDYQIPGGVTLDPGADQERQQRGPGVTQRIVWSRCVSDASALSTPKSGWLASHSPVTARAIDLPEVANMQRNLFFAGAFAGVLGGLAIEIVASTFDAVEETRQRRKVRPRRLGWLRRWRARVSRWRRRRRQKEPEQLTLWD
jgi:hypothetical protein